ncbi:hypothetical protein KHQ81_00765 [Mycoplasmatota bacterium]|nr:hypothetical protein KHQ81_00765 [Mycoplasmatota bacterium]
MISEIRIIPMSSKDDDMKNKSTIEVQHDFFMTTLMNRARGKYYYKTRIKAIPNSLFLFQYKGQIIASANLISIDEDNIKSPYKGAFLLKKDSIKIFNPITSDKFKK